MQTSCIKDYKSIIIASFQFTRTKEHNFAAFAPYVELCCIQMGELEKNQAYEYKRFYKALSDTLGPRIFFGVTRNTAREGNDLFVKLFQNKILHKILVY